jgi:hypothetical protein
MKKPFVLIVAALAVISMTLPAQGQAQVSRTTTEQVLDVYLTQADYPCLTETIHVLGTYQSTLTFNITPKGNFLYSVINRSFNITAIGLTTADAYQTNGPLQNTVVGNLAEPAPVEWTYRDIIHLIAGPQKNLYVHTLFHFTYDPATGEIKTTFDHSSVRCN